MGRRGGPGGGLISVTGFPDGPPLKSGPAVVDFLSGIHLYAATITALFERERTGRGCKVSAPGEYSPDVAAENSPG